MLLEEAGLPARLYAKVFYAETSEQIRANLAEWSRLLTRSDWTALQRYLVAAGETDFPSYPGYTPTPRGCRKLVDGSRCGLKTMEGKRQCGWHWLLGLPAHEQLEYARTRRARNEAREGYVYRARAPKDGPTGGRWCSECQAWVPDFYTYGTRCYAHGSAASHASSVKSRYGLRDGEYEQLLALQGGRCYICRQVPRKRRLAVDHDHRTGAVRGLLCANDEFGCNFTLRVLLNNVDMARRAVDYIENPPYSRLEREAPR